MKNRIDRRTIRKHQSHQNFVDIREAKEAIWRSWIPKQKEFKNELKEYQKMKGIGDRALSLVGISNVFRKLINL